MRPLATLGTCSDLPPDVPTLYEPGDVYGRQAKPEWGGAYHA